MNNLILGSHVSLKAPLYFLGSIQEALSYKADTCMIYTGAPQNSKRRPIEDLKIQEGLELMHKNGMRVENLVVHAPYIINLANTVKPETAAFGIEFLKEELNRTAAIGARFLVLHPGAHMKAGSEAGIHSIINGLNQVLKDDQSDVIICLETMAGKGTEVGSRFEEIAQIIEGTEKKERLGVCLDTCHIHDAGYDLRNFEYVLDQFDEIIGLSRLKVLHINDSKNRIGARKDRHENLGAGHIGMQILSMIVKNPRLDGLVKILETPYIDKKPPYQEEIAMLRASEPFLPAVPDQVQLDLKNPVLQK